MRRRLTLAVGLILLLLSLLMYLAQGQRIRQDFAQGRWGGSDFTAYYAAATVILEGANPYDEETFSARALELGFRADRPYIYLPLAATLLIPFTSLPAQAAVYLWFALNLVLLVSSMLWLSRLLSMGREETVPFLLAGLLFYPTLFSIFVGQINVILLLLLIAFYRYALRRDLFRAGLVVGLATLLKFFPLLWVLPLVSRLRWRAAFALGFTVLLGGGSALPLIGVSAYMDYFTGILPQQTSYYGHPLNQSAVGFFSRLPLSEPMIWQGMSLVFSGFLVSAMLYLLVRRSSDHFGTSLQISLAVTTALLIFPITWVATLVLLLFPMAVLWRTGSNQKSTASLLGVAVSYLLITLQRALELALAAGTWSPPTWLLSLPFYGVLILWSALVLQLSSAPLARSS